jgi:hypothetical protein
VDTVAQCSAIPGRMVIAYRTSQHRYGMMESKHNTPRSEVGVLTSIRHQDVEVPANPLDLPRSGTIIVLVRRIELQHVKIVVSIG